jgi:HAMP domain-containing protein
MPQGTGDRSKESAQPLDAVGALRSAFRAMRREGKPAQNE